MISHGTYASPDALIHELTAFITKAECPERLEGICRGRRKPLLQAHNAGTYHAACCLRILRTLVDLFVPAVRHHFEHPRGVTVPEGQFRRCKAQQAVARGKP